MVPIPHQRLRYNLGKFCHVRWANQHIAWKIVEFDGSKVLVQTKAGKEVEVEPHDVCYYRGFEDPW